MNYKMIVSTLVFLMASTSSADYFKGGLGMGIGGEVELENSISSEKVDLENDFPSPFLVAYGFEMTDAMYGEIEFAHRNNEYDNNSSNGVQVNSLAFNFAFRKEMDAVALNGGVGAFVGQFDYDSALNLDKGTGLGLQFFGGAEFMVSSDFALGGEVRYLMNLTDIDVGHDIDASYNQIALLITGRFMF